MSSVQEFVVEEVQVKDQAEAIEALWRSNLAGLAGDAAHAKLQLGYEANPAGSGQGFLLRDKTSATPVGIICLHRRRMFLADQEQRAGNLADYAVAPHLRTLGPALKLMRQALAVSQGQLDVLYGLPNRKSAAVCRRVGMVEIGQFRRYARILSGEHPRVQALMRQTAGLKGLTTLALRASDRVRSWSHGDELRCRSIPFDDPCIDAVWAKRPANLLLSERTRRTLAWRYGAAERGNWAIAAARDRSGAVKGIITWRLKDGVADIGDFFCVAPETATSDLLISFSRYARGRGAHSASLEFFGNSAVEAEILRAGFHPRSDCEPVFQSATDASARRIDRQDQWYITSFDNDAN